MQILINLIVTTLPLALTAGVAVFGWIVAHHFATARDRTNKQRELRVQYLIEAFRCLAGTSNRQLSPEIVNSVETAVTDVQLFGTTTQIGLVQDWAKSMSAGRCFG